MAALGSYPEPPNPVQLEQVRKIIRESGQPELVPTLAWTKPEKDIEHQLFHPKITVSRKLRPDGDMVACPFCSGGHPKCLSFYLLWSADGHLRIVGHICGPNYFGDVQFRDLDDAARRKAQKDANETFLLNNLPNLHLWLADLDVLTPVCQRAQQYRRRFMSGVASLHQELLRMIRGHEGALVILRKRETTGEGPAGFRSSLGGQESEYDPVAVAHLRGTTFLTPSYNPVSKLSKIRQPLEGLATGGAFTEDDVLTLILDLDEDGLDSAVKAIRDAHRQAVRLVERLHDIATFFSDANLDALNSWGGHNENEFKFAVERGPRSVTFRVGWEERATMPTGRELEPPVLQHLGTLVE